MTNTCRFRALTALFAAFALILALASPALAAGDSVSWDEMAYEHYDPAAFDALLEDFSAAAKDGDEEKVLALYDELYDAFLLVCTYDTIASIRNSQDVNDTYWSDELVYCDALSARMTDSFRLACHDALDGPCADALAGHIGPDAAEALRDYEPLTDRELELTQRESELVNEYYALIDTLPDTVYVYDGEDWTLDRLYGPDGAALDYAASDEIFYGIYANLAEDVAEVYRELVSIRTEMAQLAGYDDYNYFVYDNIYPRDYTPEQAQDLFDEVKELAVQLYASPVTDMTDRVAPAYDTQEDMLAVVREYAPQVDPVFADAWQFLTENGLCDVSAGPGRSDQAYTTSLPAYHCPFIFGSQTGSPDALTALFHEFGHFTADWLTEPENYLTSYPVLDVAEIQSTGLELLMLPFYDEIYDQGADIARYQTMNKALVDVTDQAIFAEFESRVYADPDQYATADALSQLYNDLSVEYGYSDIGSDPTWITVHHFFALPDYVVSYVTSALAAIQIWDAARTDWRAGADVYMDILRQGSGDLDYFAVLADAGLKSFDTPGVATEVCGRLWDAMTALESEILNGPTPAPEDDAPEETPPAETPEEDVLDVETHGLASATDAAPASEKPDVLA